jgi:hypothetical protein
MMTKLFFEPPGEPVQRQVGAGDESRPRRHYRLEATWNHPVGFIDNGGLAIEPCQKPQSPL